MRPTANPVAGSTQLLDDITTYLDSPLVPLTSTSGKVVIQYWYNLLTTMPSHLHQVNSFMTCLFLLCAYILIYFCSLQLCSHSYSSRLGACFLRRSESDQLEPGVHVITKLSSSDEHWIMAPSTMVWMGESRRDYLRVG